MDAGRQPGILPPRNVPRLPPLQVPLGDALGSGATSAAPRPCRLIHRVSRSMLAHGAAELPPPDVLLGGRPRGRRGPRLRPAAPGPADHQWAAPRTGAEPGRETVRPGWPGPGADA